MTARAAWKSEDIDTAAGDRGQWLVSALDSAKRPHVAYRNGSGKLFHARWTGSQWIRSQVDQGLDDGLVKNLGIGLAVDKDGNAHVSYYDNGNVYDQNGDFVTHRANLKYARWNGSGWSRQTVVSDHDAGEYNSLALDSEDRPHICYYYQNIAGANDWFGTLQYIRWNGGAWERETVDASGSGNGGRSGEYCQLAIDKTDTPRVIYRSVTESNYIIREQLRYATRQPSGSWAAENVTLDQDAWGTALALAPDGTPHIAFYDPDQRSLYHLSRSSEGWSGSVIDSGFGAGLYHSISVGTGGAPSVAYADENYRLVLATRDGASWRASTVSENVCLGVAVRHGVNDTPLVTYYHPGTGLHLARTATPEIEVRQPESTKLTDGTSRKSFGTVPIGGKGKTKTFTIRNTGNLKLRNLAVTKNGAQRDDFIVTQPARATLAPGASTTFTVSFKPRAKGTREAALHIRSNDADENPFDIRLGGQGVSR